MSLFLFELFGVIGTLGIAFYAVLGEFYPSLAERYNLVRSHMGRAAEDYKHKTGAPLILRLRFDGNHTLILASEDFSMPAWSQVPPDRGRPRVLWPLRLVNFQRRWPLSIRFPTGLPPQAPLVRMAKKATRWLDEKYRDKPINSFGPGEIESVIFLHHSALALSLLGRMRIIRFLRATFIFFIFVGGLGSLSVLFFSNPF